MVVDPAFWSGRRVLVTGHTGFKGSWLSLWLSSMGADVTGLSHDIPTTPSLFELARVGEDVRDLRGDVRDFETLRAAAEGAEIVLHLAAQPIVRRSFAEPRETYEINVMGTVNVLEAAREAGARAIVNVTSDKCYENREWEWAYREDEPMGGHDPYSSSKGAAELVTSAYRRSFGLPLASARAGNVIGGGDWGADRLIPDVMRSVAGQAVEIRNPGATRPWQHVLNPLSGYIVLAQAVYDDPTFATGWNFGPRDEDARPVSWLLERLDALWPGGLNWALDAGEHPPEARFLKVDSSRARTLLGWAPAWGLERALEAIVEWYLAVRDGADVRTITLEQLAAFTSSTPLPVA